MPMTMAGNVDKIVPSPSVLEVARALLAQGVDPRVIAGATGIDSATLAKLKR
jgi:hypothetical protein